MEVLPPSLDHTGRLALLATNQQSLFCSVLSVPWRHRLNIVIDMTVLLYPDIDIRVWMGLTDNIQMAKILTDN